MVFLQRQHSLVIHTPAKLNLFLNILGKRSDGFHELETLMTSINLFDTLTFQQNPEGQINLRCSFSGQSYLNPATQHKQLPATADNLVYRAALLLKEFASVEEGVNIRLVKRIPVASGLAGGSSNAAATLVGLNKLWKLNLSIEQLQHLANQLGSDISFFISPSPLALCLGRGEIISSVSPQGSRLHFVIVRPACGLSTAQVYQNYQESQTSQSAEALTSAIAEGNLQKIGNAFYNALEEPARKLNGEIDQVLQQLNHEKIIGTLMSGSGTACFGLCSSQREARSIANRIRLRNCWQVFSVSTAT